MDTYFAFLRAVNVGGKNKIPMAELKRGLAESGFSAVQTYLNSGNISFSCAAAEPDHIAKRIDTLIRQMFGLDIPVAVYTAIELKKALEQAPQWWGTDDAGIYDNLILMLPGYTTETFLEKIGATKVGLEWTQKCDRVVFWSFDRKNYAKTNWWPRSAQAGIGEMITIRTAGTIRKMLAKCGM